MKNISRRDFIKGMGLGSAYLITLPEHILSRNRDAVRDDVQANDIIRGIYVPGWRAVNRDGIDNLMTLLNETELDTLMVDVKNARGELFYSPKTALAKSIDSQVKTKAGSYRSLNFDYLLEHAYKQNVRLIGRHVMFRDHNLHDAVNEFRLWENAVEKWVDMRNDGVIDYNIQLLEEESAFGCDEIVLDYMRFPATGKFGTEREKCEIIDEIAKKAGMTVKGHDTDFGIQVFGYTAWHHDKAGVGQRIPTLSSNADTIYPMLYPSHFWPGSFGFEEPSDHPYEFIEMGYNEAIKKVTDKTRIIPMIQAFRYAPDEINSQIDAVYDCKMPGYVCWNPSGRYKELNAALRKR